MTASPLVAAPVIAGGVMNSATNYNPNSSTMVVQVQNNAGPAQNNAAVNKPRVVVIDLDGTLIGRIGNAVCEYEIAKMLDSSARGQHQTHHLRAFRTSLISRLRYGIIRPHVEHFCKSVPAGTELFIYTASDQEWAAFLIPCVEAALDVKFNRPIFTRKQCHVENGEYRKSLRRILPTIQRALRRKGYPAQMTTPSKLMEDMVLVDNTPTVLVEDRKNLVVCPTYSYNYVYDVLRTVDVDTLHRNYKSLVPPLQRAGLFPLAPGAPGSYQQFAAIYYTSLSRTIASSANSNLKSIQTDRFFARLGTALNSIVRREVPLITIRTLMTPREPAPKRDVIKSSENGYGPVKSHVRKSK